MTAVLDTAGERLRFGSELGWVDELVEEGAGGLLRPDDGRRAGVHVVVERERRPFSAAGWEPLTRGAWRRGRAVVIENACTSGFDLHAECAPDRAEFTFRWRPPPRDRAAARVLRSRFHLLARAALTQFPALWRAGVAGRVPLHASACVLPGSAPLLASAGGIGRSTLVLDALRDGAAVTGDNLAVADETSVWGLVEPLRVEGAAGRRMPHGRGEVPAPAPVRVRPDTVVVLERGGQPAGALLACDAPSAARALVAGTYMAGELRRYWAFAATLAAGTGYGPAHPPLTRVASALAASLPCYRLRLGSRPGRRLPDLLSPIPREPACA